MPANNGRIVEAALYRFPDAGEIRQVLMKFREVAACIDGSFGGTVVTDAGDKFKKFIDVIFNLQQCFLLITSRNERGNRKKPGIQMRLNGVGERDAVEVVFAVRTSFEKKFAFVR